MITHNSLKKSFRYTWNVLHWLHTISRLFLHICCIVDGIVHFIWMRGWVNNYPHSVSGIHRYQFKKEEHHFSTWSPSFPIHFVHLNKLFLPVTKFILYISPYIYFSRFVPVTYVLLLLKVPLCRLWMLHEAPDFQSFRFMLIRWTHCVHMFMLTCTLLAFVVNHKC